MFAGRQVLVAGAVVLPGADAGVTAAALARHAPDVPVQWVPASDDEPMTAAVEIGRGLARPGDVVPMAPAVADMFRDYAQRGEAFTEAVRTLAGAPHDRR